MGDAPPEAVRELAPTGRLRAAINLGNPVLAQQDPGTGEPRGASVELARELGRRLGLGIELVTFDSAGKAFAALRSGTCDVGFLAIDPARAADLAFTASYLVIEGTYLVRSTSPLRSVEDFDREGVRIAAVKGAAYDLHLSRTLRHATLVHAPTSLAALELFLRDALDAAAGVRQPLEAFAAGNPGLRVLEGSFMAIGQAMATPRDREAGAGFLDTFVAEVRASGFVDRVLGTGG